MSGDTGEQRMKAIFTTQFVEVPFPEPIRTVLISNGGMPLKAVVWKRKDDVAYGMFAVEPCGENGELQRHMSISASSRGKGRRWPTDDEVSQAAEAVGLKLTECEVLRRNEIVHLFRTSR